MSRDAMLQRLSLLTDLSDCHDLPGDLPEFPHPANPVTEFKKQLERVKGRFSDGRGKGMLLEALNEILVGEGSRVAWEDPPALASYGLSFELNEPTDDLNPLYFSRLDEPLDLPIRIEARKRTPRTAAEIEVSVSAALFGVAETGTVVESSGDKVGRMLSVIAPVHVVLLSETNLLNNHAELFQKLIPGSIGSAQILMTGPSRTADIEKTLVLGVHGPKEIFVILTL